MFTFFSASFGGDQIPSDEGTLTAILSRFNGIQLNMRNAADADFEGGGGGDPQDVSAAELRSLFESGASSVPAAQKLRGVVISDGGNGNTTGRNLVLQDDSGGIIVRFADNHSFALGEDIEIIVSGEELSEFNGLLQVMCSARLILANGADPALGSVPFYQQVWLLSWAVQAYG